MSEKTREKEMFKSVEKKSEYSLLITIVVWPAKD